MDNVPEQVLLNLTFRHSLFCRKKKKNLCGNCPAIFFSELTANDETSGECDVCFIAALQSVRAAEDREEGDV